MAKASKTLIAIGDVKGRMPQSAWAMSQASMTQTPGPKSKINKKRDRIKGKGECDRRNW